MLESGLRNNNDLITGGKYDNPILRMQQHNSLTRPKCNEGGVSDVRRLYQSPITKYRLPTTDHRPPTTDHRPPITDHRSPITNHQSPITNHQSPIPLPLSPFL